MGSPTRVKTDTERSKSADTKHESLRGTPYRARKKGKTLTQRRRNEASEKSCGAAHCTTSCATSRQSHERMRQATRRPAFHSSCSEGGPPSIREKRHLFRRVPRLLTVPCQCSHCPARIPTGATKAGGRIRRGLRRSGRHLLNLRGVGRVAGKAREVLVEGRP